MQSTSFRRTGRLREEPGSDGSTAVLSTLTGPLWRPPRGSRIGRLVALAVAASLAVAVPRLRGAWRSHHRSLALHHPVPWSPGAGASQPAALSARVLGSHGRPVVLLHGLGGSKSLWGSTYDALASDHRVVALDLLGHGASPRPDSAYTLVEHADLVVRALADLGLADQPVLLVGHSFGGLVALTLAREHPESVAGLLAISPPLYRSAADALALTAGALTSVERFLYLPSWYSRLICRNLCMRRPRLAATCGRWLRRDLPAELVDEAVRHTWESYSRSIAELLDARARPEWLGALRQPVRLLAGSDDAMVDQALLAELACNHEHIDLEVVDGANHLLPISHADRCRGAVQEMSAAL